MKLVQKVFFVNGIERNVFATPEATLADVLRQQLGLTGTKVGCNEGMCGACSVIIDGKVVRACVMKMKRVECGAQITTIEGIGQPDNLHPLQKAWAIKGAAQCGFCSPGFIVAAKALLDQNSRPTREEVRDWFQKHRNACRCTGYIPIVDAVMDAAAVMRGEMRSAELEFKMPTDGRIIGTNYPRPTAIAKVCGTLDYGADIGFKLPPGSLHCALVQTEVSHANIKGIDVTEAEKMPGVYKVVTYKDVKGKNRITGLITFPTNKGDGWERPILCDKKIFQYGDAVAIVCADNYENACAAAKAVKVDLEVLPAYMSAPAAMAPDAIEIHPGTPNVYWEIHHQKGEDTKPIFEKAHAVVEGDFYVGRQPHMPIEPDVGFAYTNEDGMLMIHSKTIGAHLHLFMIAPGLGLEPNVEVALACNPMGGTFGYKFSPTMEALVGAASYATGRPCFLNYTWYQQQTYTGKRSPMFYNVRLAADKDGKLLGMETDWSCDHGPYSEFGDLVTLRGLQFCGSCYNIPAIRGHGRTVCTNHSWGSAFRAYGSPQSIFASEACMELLAEKLGMDPFDLRYVNLYREGSTNATGQAPEVFTLPEQFDLLRPKYQAALAKAKAESTPEKMKGVGLACGMYGCGLDGPDGSEAWAVLNEDDTITVVTAWEDHGQGADIGAITSFHEGAQPMKIDPARLRFTWPNTALCPNSGPSGGSRQQVMTGGACFDAGQKFAEGMKKADGTYCMTYAEAKEAGKELKYVGKHTAVGATECSMETGIGAPFTIYMYGAFMSEVTVDTKTGKVTVDKMTMTTDIGRIVNQTCIDGQVYGGLAQGIGLALTEDFEDIKKHSTMVGAGFPYIKDIPDEMEIIWVNTPRAAVNHGAAGIGEMPLTCPHGAVINAINNACGVKIHHLPAYPEKVLAGLKAKGLAT